MHELQGAAQHGAAGHGVAQGAAHVLQGAGQVLHELQVLQELQPQPLLQPQELQESQQELHFLPGQTTHLSSQNFHQ